MPNVLPAARTVAAGGNDHFSCAPSPVNGVESACAMSSPGVRISACTWYLLCDGVLELQPEKGPRHYDSFTMLHRHICTKRLDKADSNTVDNM